MGTSYVASCRHYFLDTAFSLEHSLRNVDRVFEALEEVDAQ